MINKLHALLPNSNFLHLLMKLITKKTYKILFNGIESDAFNLQNGLPQGDSLSPTLFSIFMNDLAKEIYSNTELLNAAVIGNFYVPSLIYADDILLMSNDEDGLMKQIKIVHKFCSDNGLEINYDKTKVMIQNVKYDDDYIRINYDNEIKHIEIVKEYKYLGFWISHNTKKHLISLANKGKKLPI